MPHDDHTGTRHCGQGFIHHRQGWLQGTFSGTGQCGREWPAVSDVDLTGSSLPTPDSRVRKHQPAYELYYQTGITSHRTTINPR